MAGRAPQPRQQTLNNRLGGPQIVAAAVILALTLIWIVWPSDISHVTNLESGGAATIAFGDSLTAGYGATEGEDYPSRLSVTTGITILNAGRNGDTTKSALERIESDVLTRDPRLVIIGLGGNDYLRKVPIETTEENLRTIIRRVQESGAAVILLGFRFPSLTTRYGPMYERVAEEEGALLIPDLLDGILSNPSLRSDTIHPNAAGYEIMAERIKGPLEALVDAMN